MDTYLSAVLVEKAELMEKRGDQLFSVTSDTNAAEAIRIMCEANIGCVLVIDDNTLVGIFSERDALHQLCNKNISPQDKQVSELMTRDVVTVNASVTVADALAECTDRRVRHLPVVDKGQLLGLLSIGDLVRFVVKDKERTIADLICYIHSTPVRA
ncbi:MAG: CBS domain-containing protein [Wenzhouxiangellaceae bacterium]